MANKTADAVLKSWKEVKVEIESLLKSSKIKEVQTTFQKFVKTAEKDINRVVDKDLPKLVKKLQSERKTLEKAIDKAVQEEIKKAKKFVNQLQQ